ncbi:BRCA1-associated RING domain protein 1 [Aplochiton taeniatus]
MCEHTFCRSCAGDCCVVCKSPAWVQDIQINRQLSNITELFRKLENTLNPIHNSDSAPQSPAQAENTVLKHKKSFKIWFSPRSRKVRCRVEKPTAVTVSDSRPATESPSQSATTQPKTPLTETKDLSIFNFNMSSQDSGSSSPKRKTRSGSRTKPDKVKETEQNNQKQRLETVNQQWGFCSKRVLPGEGELTSAGEEADQRSSKRVSFVNSGVLSEEPPGPTSVLSPSRSILKGKVFGENIVILGAHGQSQNHPQTVTMSINGPTKPIDGSGNNLKPSSPTQTPKRSRVDEKANTLDSTPKRPTPSPGQIKGSTRKKYPALPTPPSPSSPLSPASPLPPMSKTRRSREGHGDSPRSPAYLCRRSQGALGTPGGRSATGSPATVKRNHKGETPLHLAAIKGDMEAVTELLDHGADPNLKDNAGWTPLHEACNLGHQSVVELLVPRGALLNTPGYENDSPLHDAVRNGHPAIVKLLLQHGASQSVMNMFGLRPADYAASPQMKAIFQAAAEGVQPANAPLSPPPSLSMVTDVPKKEERMVILASRLSPNQRNQLAKLGQLLGVNRADSFSSSVSHVVVPDGPAPTTLSCLLGTLSGCWVLTFSWVEACFQAGGWTAEGKHEAGEGARRSRLNRHSLLPPLFDGCFFFLLGSFQKLPKEDLLQLIREGGGQLLSRQPKPDSDVTQTLSAAAYHASSGSDQALCTQYILYDPQGPHKPPTVRRGKVWSAPCTWLVDCVAAFQLLPVPEC